MLIHLTTLGLGPVLIWQGRRVRRTVPVLPEPDGPREGRQGAGMLMRLLIVGDSAAAGVGVQFQHEALTGVLARELTTEFDLDWKLVAKTGYTVTDLIARLQAEPPGAFHTVVVSIGVNDVTGLTGRRHWQGQINALCELLRQRFEAQHILLTQVPPMHLFPALPQPLRWYLGWRARLLNIWMKQAVGAASDVTVVETFAEPDPAMMAADGFHPGPLGYRSWGQLVAELCLERRG